MAQRNRTSSLPPVTCAPRTPPFRRYSIPSGQRTTENGQRELVLGSPLSWHRKQRPLNLPRTACINPLPRRRPHKLRHDPVHASNPPPERVAPSRRQHRSASTPANYATCFLIVSERALTNRVILSGVRSCGRSEEPLCLRFVDATSDAGHSIWLRNRAFRAGTAKQLNHPHESIPHCNKH